MTTWEEENKQLTDDLMHLRGDVEEFKSFALRCIQMEEELSRARSEVVKKSSLLDALIGLLPVAVVIGEVHPESPITTEEQAEKMFRNAFMASKDLEGQDLHRGFHPDGQPYGVMDWPLVRSITTGEVVVDEEIAVPRSDGTCGVMLVSSSPARDEKGSIFAGIAIVHDVTERRKAEQSLIQSFQYRGEIDSALKALLRQREEDKREFEEAVMVNVKNFIVPYLERLKKSQLNRNQMNWLSVLENSINEITSGFGRTLTLRHMNLTPTEIRVATLVRDGKSTKEIADTLGMSERSASTHRDNIRGKLGLRGGRGNLRAYLLGLT